MRVVVFILLETERKGSGKFITLLIVKNAIGCFLKQMTLINSNEIFFEVANYVSLTTSDNKIMTVLFHLA